MIADEGYDASVAAMVLNLMLGNVGATLSPSANLGPSKLSPKGGSTKDLSDFAKAAHGGEIDIAFITGTNPLFSAPNGLNMPGALDKVGFSVAVAIFEDETVAACDVVLPLASSLEDWGSHIPTTGTAGGEIHMQQPLMEKLHPDVLGLGDILLGLAKDVGVEGLDQFEDYYGYLRTAISALIETEEEAIWNDVLQAGKIIAPATPRTFRIGGTATFKPPTPESGELTLVTTPRQGLYDGRHANLPWLQEAPDQISKAVWDSWAELHPKTAAKLGLKDGDTITITSDSGSITTRVFTYKGVHPDAICVPMGRGHTNYGRYATDNGVNPLSILDGSVDPRTGELNLVTTRVHVQPTGDNRYLVRLMDTDRQHGRKLAATIPASQLRRTEGGA